MKNLDQKLEELLQEAEDWRKQPIDARVLRIEERLDGLLLEYLRLKFVLEDVADIQSERLKIPHRCPVCNGSPFDEEDALCYPCDGKGIVWG